MKRPFSVKRLSIGLAILLAVELALSGALCFYLEGPGHLALAPQVMPRAFIDMPVDSPLEQRIVSRTDLTPILVPPAPPPPLSPATVDIAPVPTAPLRDVTLTGTIIAGEQRLAVIRDGGPENRDGSSIALHEGEMLDDWQLMLIEPHAITLERAGEKRRLMLPDEKPESAPAAVPAPVTVSPESNPAS
jgi:hypothetical protein